jgi:hypothetical protein
MCSRLFQEEAVPTGHERGKELDLWTATHTEAAIVGLCLLTLVIGLSTSQRQRRTIVEISARSESHAKALGKVRLLEFRAADLSIQVEELERRRDFLGDAGAEVLDLRALLAKGGRKADLKFVTLEAAAENSHFSHRLPKGTTPDAMRARSFASGISSRPAARSTGQEETEK